MSSRKLDSESRQGVWRRSLWTSPRATNLLEMLSGPAAACADLEEIHLCHHGGAPEAITWGELWRAARLEGARFRKAGIQATDRVLLILPTSREFFAAFFGVLAAGGIVVPAPTPQSLKSSRLGTYFDLLSGIVEDSGAAVCVTLPRFHAVIRAGLSSEIPVLTVEPRNRFDDQLECVQASPGDTALLQYTSGSTSRPKGVELTHANVLANTAAITQLIAAPDTICVSWLPLYHDMGLIGAALSALYCGRPAVFMPPSAFVKSPATWLRCISQYCATITVAPNFAFDYCVKNIELDQVADVRLDSLRVALNGAEPIDAGAIRRFHEKFKPLGLRDNVVLPVYGLAESSLAVAFAEPGPYVIDEVDAGRLETDARAIPATGGARSRGLVSVGRPIPSQEVRIVGGSDSPLPDRCIGEVAVRGPSVMKGYFNRPVESSFALRGGWLHTGDLGYLADGRLFITGRQKDMIIRHGRNYFPEDIEALIARVDGVSRGATAAFGVEVEGRTLIVIIAETRLRDDGALTRLARQIKQHCHDAFAFGPDEVRLAPPGSIPRTTSGKVKRQECKRKYLDGELYPRWLTRASDE